MMLYQNRVFVATSSFHDFTDGEGFGGVQEDPVPRIFAPLNASVYGDPIIRMGVMGLHSMQKSVHLRFTSGERTEVTESMWADAIAINKLVCVTHVILETADKIWVAIISPIQAKAQVSRNGVVVEEQVEEPTVTFTMQLMEVTIPGVLFTDSMMVLKNQECTDFTLSAEIARLPPDITAQLILDMYNLHDSEQLYKWAPNESDAVGINETLVPFCTKPQLRGYANFLTTPPPANKKLLS